MRRWLIAQWHAMDAEGRYLSGWAAVLAIIGGTGLLVVVFAGWGAE